MKEQFFNPIVEPTPTQKMTDTLLIALWKERFRYQARVNDAYAFANGLTGEAWNGGFIMGLALAGLNLIPTSTGISPEWYWVKAPKPKGDTGEWDSCWIVPINEFHTVKHDGN